MRVRELLALLAELEPDAEVFVAVQPSWPFEHRLLGVAVREDFTETDEDADEVLDRWSAHASRLPKDDVLLVAGDQVRYGDAAVWDVVRRS